MPRAAVPLGADFHRLWAGSTISNVGDGITIVAGPLLVVSMTSNPVYVAAAAFCGAAPWLLFSLISGAYVDRLDRRRLMIIVNVLRGLALLVLATAVATDTVCIPLIYLILFLHGVGETLADPAAQALLPNIVPPERLGAANSRLMASFTIGNQFLAKPLGAWLFTTAAALPFAMDALSFFIAAALMSSVRPIPLANPPSEQARDLRAEVWDGLRWLLRHKLLRTLGLCLSVGNIVYCAAFAIFVLYAKERLGVTQVGYGFLLTTFAIGGLLGTLLANRLERRFGTSLLLRGGLIVETCTHLVLACSRQTWLIAATLIVFGVHTMVWGVVVITMRQHIVPENLRGRVNGAYAFFDAGGAALGALLGGFFASLFGITAPFWIAFATMTVVAVLAWNTLRQAPDLKTLRQRA